MTKHGTKITVGLKDRLTPLPAGSRRLFILRHGETDRNAAGILQGGGIDSNLTPLGKAQAVATGEALIGQPIQVVVSSNLARSKQTADTIVDVLRQSHNHSYSDVGREVSEDFREMSFGDFEGTPIFRRDCPLRTKLRFARRRSSMRRNNELKWPGQDGESVNDVVDRGIKGLSTVFANEDARYVCVVAHGGFNKLLLGRLTGTDERKIEQRNTSVSVLDVDMATGVWTPQVLDHADHALDEDTISQKATEAKKSLLSRVFARMRRTRKSASLDSSFQTLATTSLLSNADDSSVGSVGHTDV